MGFAADFKRICDAAGDKAEMVVRKAALDIGGQLIDRSPVDTGRFKSNWFTSAGAMKESISTDADKSGAPSIGRLQREVAGWEPGQTIWIVNNLPYAQELEYGHSQQAPQGMVRLTVQDFKQAVVMAAREVK